MASREALIHGKDLWLAATELYNQHGNPMPDTITAVKGFESIGFIYDERSPEKKSPNWISRLIGASALDGAELYAAFSRADSSEVWDVLTQSNSGRFNTALLEVKNNALTIDEPRTLELIERFLVVSPDDFIMEQFADLSGKEQARLVGAIDNMIYRITTNVKRQIDPKDFTVDYRLPYELTARIYYKKSFGRYVQADQSTQGSASASFSIMHPDPSLDAPIICEAYYEKGLFGTISRFDSGSGSRLSSNFQSMVGLIEVVASQADKGLPNFGSSEASTYDIERSIQPAIEGLSPRQLEFLQTLMGPDK